jgi:hypothetical protein
MATEYDDKKLRAYRNRRALMDYGMGILYLAAGGFLLLANRLGRELDFLPEPYSYIFGGLLLIYGVFRIYRGYKKNYFY